MFEKDKTVEEISEYLGRSNRLFYRMLCLYMRWINGCHTMDVDNQPFLLYQKTR